MIEKAIIPAKAAEAKKDAANSGGRKGEISDSPGSPFDRVLFLQRVVGNKAVERQFDSDSFRRKFNCRQPRDAYGPDDEAVYIQDQKQGLDGLSAKNHFVNEQMLMFSQKQAEFHCNTLHRAAKQLEPKMLERPVSAPLHELSELRFPIVIKNPRGLPIGPFVVGKQITFTIYFKPEMRRAGASTAHGRSSERPLEHRPGAEKAVEVGISANKDQIRAEISARVNESIKVNLEPELSRTGGSLSGGIDFKIFDEDDSSFTVSLDILLFKRNGKEVERFKPEITLTGTQTGSIQLPNGLRLSATVIAEVSLTVEVDWRKAARYGWRLARATKTILKHIGKLVRNPYVAVPAAYAAWLGFVLYKLAEAKRAGIRWGLEVTFANGYADGLREEIKVGQGRHQWENVEAALSAMDVKQDLLDVNVQSEFDRAIDISQERCSETPCPNYEFLAKRKRAKAVSRLAGKAAAIQFVEMLINQIGVDAWEEWCNQQKDPDVFRSRLVQRAIRHEMANILEPAPEEA